MKIKWEIIAKGLLLIIIVSGCIVYPQTADVPLISEKNDLRVDAGISLVPSATATFSYGLTNKVAAQVFGLVGSDERRYLEGAFGLYKKLQKNLVREFYAGFGVGHGSAYNDANPGDLYSNYQLYFTRVNFGKVNARFAHMDYGIGIRTGILNSYLTDRNYFNRYGDGPFPSYRNYSFLVEPGLFARFGGERLKLNLKVGGAWIYQFTNRDKRLPVSPFNVGLSLNYQLNTSKEKSNNLNIHD